MTEFEERVRKVVDPEIQAVEELFQSTEHPDCLTPLRRLIDALPLLQDTKTEVKIIESVTKEIREMVREISSPEKDPEKEKEKIDNLLDKLKEWWNKPESQGGQMLEDLGDDAQSFTQWLLSEITKGGYELSDIIRYVTLTNLIMSSTKTLENSLKQANAGIDEANKDIQLLKGKEDQHWRLLRDKLVELSDDLSEISDDIYRHGQTLQSMYADFRECCDQIHDKLDALANRIGVPVSSISEDIQEVLRAVQAGDTDIESLDQYIRDQLPAMGELMQQIQESQDEQFSTLMDNIDRVFDQDTNQHLATQLIAEAARQCCLGVRGVVDSINWKVDVLQPVAIANNSLATLLGLKSVQATLDEIRGCL